MYNGQKIELALSATLVPIEISGASVGVTIEAINFPLLEGLGNLFPYFSFNFSTFSFTALKISVAMNILIRIWQLVLQECITATSYV